MPYANVDALPDAVKSALPPHGQAIWMAAFNSAMAEHKDEAKAAATAWAAVKTRYEQDAKGNWHPKASSESGRPLIHRSRFSEANATPNLTMLENGDFRIDIIRHGFNDDRTTYYPERVLQAAVAAGMYENAKMYFNHAGKQDFERGYRDVRAWGATILPGTVTFENGAVKGVAHAHHTDLLQILNDPVARAQVGISHEADGAYKFKEIDKKRAQHVEALTRVYSVDIVPAGNAGGRIAETTKEFADMDMDGLTIAELREARPDLLKEIEESVSARLAEAAKPKEPVVAAEAPEVVKLREAQTAMERRLQASEDELKRRDTLDGVRRICEAEAKLPASVRGRVVERFVGRIVEADKLGDEVKGAIGAEQEYAKALLHEAGVGTRPHGAGADGNPGTAYKPDGSREFAEEHGIEFHELPGDKP